MANVGKKTGKQTQAGRDVYETPEGEMVSEKSTTFEYKGKWINIPTIHGGKQYSEDQLMEMLDKGLIKPTSTHDELEEAIQAAQSRSDSLEFNKGGTPMLEKQMELFEDGGLRDEGGMVDEESGNEVPVGSTRKEVRDDIPAMLRECEFVFPADVVRYIGLENLMRIRQDAKQGLKQMEAMGQMGNGDEAVLPDDMPFGMMDLIIIEGEEEEEPQKKARGGVIHAQQGTFVTPMFDPSNQDVREYKNEAGDSLFIPFLGGEPVYPIPAGYFPAGQVPDKTETEEAIPTGGDDDDTPPPPQSEFQKAGGWDMDFGDPPDPKKVDLWISEAEKTSTFGNVATGVAAAINPLLAVGMHLGNTANKKGIEENYKRAVAAASKTPTKGQLKRLKDVDKRLTTKEGKNILSKALNSIIDGFGNIFNSEEEKNAAKVQSGVAVGTGSNLSEEEIKKRINIGKSGLEKMADAREAERLANFIASEDQTIIDAGSKLKEDGTYDISSWFTPTPELRDPEEDIDLFPPTGPVFEAPPTPTEIRDMAEQSARIRETTGTALETDAMSDFPTHAVRKQDTDFLDNFIRADDAAVLGAVKTENQNRDTQTLSVPEDQTTAAFGPVEAYTPEMSTTSTVTQQVQDYIGNLRSPLSITGRTMYEKFDPRTTLEELTNKLAQSTGRGRGRDDEPSAPTTPAPTAYQAGQQRRTSRNNNDDDGPSFASVGDNATAAQQASQNVTTTVEKDESGNVTGVTTTGGTAEEQQTMQDYVTSAAAGAKGGLFTRRKNKKK